MIRLMESELVQVMEGSKSRHWLTEVHSVEVGRLAVESK